MNFTSARLMTFSSMLYCFTSSLACLRAITEPSWAATPDTLLINFLSSRRRRLLKKSSTAMTLQFSNTGIATADLLPPRSAYLLRKHFSSLLTSSIHSGSLDAQTLPGRPTPMGKVNWQLICLNSSSPLIPACQTGLHSSSVPSRLGIHASPIIQPVVSQTSFSTTPMLDFRSSALLTAMIIVCSSLNSSSVCLRSVMFWAVPRSPTILPSESRLASPRAEIHLVVAVGLASSRSRPYGCLLYTSPSP